jgi:hypothetical protein
VLAGKGDDSFAFSTRYVHTRYVCKSMYSNARSFPLVSCGRILPDVRWSVNLRSFLKATQLTLAGRQLPCFYRSKP